MSAPSTFTELVPRSWAGRAALIALAALGAFACLWNLGSANYDGDEVVYVEAGWAYLHGDPTPNPEHPPLAKYLYGIAQLLAGEGPLGPRIVAGLCTLGAGAVLYVWMTRAAGWPTGAVAAAAWLVLPRTSDDLQVRLDRHALLEPVMVLFLAAACWAAWEWRRSPRRDLLAALAGVLLACAALAKITALMAVPGLLAALLWGLRDARAAARGLLIAAACGALAGLLLYLPVDPVASIRSMLEMQGAHNAGGHVIEIADHPMADAPWWAHAWFMLSGFGWKTFAFAVAGGVLAAAATQRAPLVAFLGAILASMLGVSSLLSNVALSHYYEAWAWLVMAIAAVGVTATLDRAQAAAPPARALAAGAAILALVAAAGLLGRVWTSGPSGLARVDALLAADPAADGDVLVVDVSPGQAARYLGGRAVDDLEELAGRDVRAIVVGRDDRRPELPEVAALLDRGGLRSFDADGILVVPLDGRLAIEDGALAVADGGRG